MSLGDVMKCLLQLAQEHAFVWLQYGSSPLTKPLITLYYDILLFSIVPGLLINAPHQLWKILQVTEIIDWYKKQWSDRTSSRHVRSWRARVKYDLTWPLFPPVLSICIYMLAHVLLLRKIEHAKRLLTTSKPLIVEINGINDHQPW
jgi:hypothetical protein